MGEQIEEYNYKEKEEAELDSVHFSIVTQLQRINKGGNSRFGLGSHGKRSLSKKTKNKDLTNKKSYRL